MLPLSALLSPDWRDRKAAIEQLHDSDDATLIESLVYLVRENNENLASVGGAIQLLQRVGRPVLGNFVGLLAHPSADVRSAAALVLGECGPREAVDALREALRDEDQNVRYHAIEALGKLGAQEAVEDLIAILAEGDFFLVFPAIDALSRVGDRTVVPVLLEMLSDAMLSGPLANALGEMGNPAVAGALAGAIALDDVDAVAVISAVARIHQRHGERRKEVREAFLGGLDVAGQARLLEVARQVPAEGAAAIVRVLGWMTEEEVLPLLQLYLHTSSARSSAAEALVARGEESVPILLEALNANEEQVRRVAVDSLARLGTGRAVPRLLETLASADTNLAVRVAAALGRIGGEEAVEGLLTRLGHSSPLVRQALVEALIRVRDEAVVERLLGLLRSGDALVREAASLALDSLEEERVRDALLEAASDPVERVRRGALGSLTPWLRTDARVREKARSALRHGGPVERAAAARVLASASVEYAAPLLQDALGDSDVWTRIQAGRSLVALCGRDALEHVLRLAIDSAPPVRAAAAEALGALGANESVGALGKLVRDDEPDVVFAAIWALAGLHHEEAVAMLVELSRVRNPHLRHAAVAALRNHRGREAVRALVEAAQDPETRSLAVQSLAVSPDPGALDALIGMLGEPALRGAATRALASRGEEALEALRRTLGGSDRMDVRAAVVGVAGLTDRGEALLLAALEDREASVRRASVNALYGRGGGAVRDGLRRVAESDPEEGVRKAALRALRA
jgi:HEAT repeat protein